MILYFAVGLLVVVLLFGDFPEEEENKYDKRIKKREAEREIKLHSRYCSKCGKPCGNDDMNSLGKCDSCYIDYLYL